MLTLPRTTTEYYASGRISTLKSASFAPNFFGQYIFSLFKHQTIWKCWNCFLSDVLSMVVYHLPKRFRNFGWNVNGGYFGVPDRKISKIFETFWNVVQDFQPEFPKTTPISPWKWWTTTVFLNMIPWYCFTKVIPSITLRSSKDIGPWKKVGTQFISMMANGNDIDNTSHGKFDWSSKNKSTCCTCVTHLRTIPYRPLQNKTVKLPYDNFSAPL